MLYNGGTRTDSFTGRVSYLGTGIANLGAAKRYLKHKFSEGTPEPVATRPGARFYVTARTGGRTAYLAGPFVSHMTAQERAPRVRAILQRNNPYAFHLSVGTASRPDTVPTRFGRAV